MLEEKRENQPFEPQEVVSWYTPRAKEGNEVVSYYVQPNELPEKARHPEPPAAKKRSRRGLWIFLICMAVLLAAVIIGAIVWNHSGPEEDPDLPPEEGDASSIVDIFVMGGTDIPKVAGDPNVRLQVQTSHGAELTPQEVYAAVNPAVVTVVANKQDMSSIGTGVIMTEDGYIITNNHVVEGADTLTVRTKAGEEFEATLIGADAQTDIAVIKIEANDLPAATLGTSSDLLVGQRSIAIGNPLGELGGTVTIGYISALDREVSIDGVKMTLLQTDAAINPGNSGGGLFDVNGRLIGVVNAKSTGSDIEGLGFAIPIDTAKEIATDILENGHVTGRPALGVKVSEVTSSNYHEFRGDPLYRYITDYGVYIVEDERGNFEYGDLIVAFNDITVSTQTDLAAALNECQIGDTVTVTVSRNRKLVRIELELVELSA